MMRRRTMFGLVGVLIALTVVGTAPATAQYPPAAQAQQLSSSQVRPGEPITVTGSGFAPSSTVTISFDTQVLGRTVARTDGVFTTTVTIPANATPGTHTIASSGINPDGTPRRLTSTVTVLGATANRGGTLPRTGIAGSLPLAVAGTLLIGVGTVAVRAARRRSRSTDSPVPA